MTLTALSVFANAGIVVAVSNITYSADVIVSVNGVNVTIVAGSTASSIV